MSRALAVWMIAAVAIAPAHSAAHASGRVTAVAADRAESVSTDIVTDLAATVASGPSARTIVVGPGGDHVALAAAVQSARDGDRIEVRGGVHAGPLAVEHAIDIVGFDRPVIDGGGEGTVVSVTAPGASIRGVLIRNSGSRGDKEDAGIRAEARVTVEDVILEDVLYGINLKAARGSVLRGNTVRGRDIHIARRGDAIRVWESHDSIIQDNVVEGARDVVIWYSERLKITGNTVRDGRYGLHYMYSHQSVIEDNRLEGNSVGAFMMYSTGLSIRRNVFAANHGSSGYGLALKDSDEVVTSDNVMAGNRVGLYLDNSPSRQGEHNTVERNTIAWNDVGVLLQPSVARNDFSENGFVENGQQVALTGGGSADGNSWSTAGVGNHWSNYAGLDADGDGIGDRPHVEVALFDEMVERYPLLRLFIHSPAANALDLAARAFPVFRPPPTLTDEAPLVSAPPASVVAPVPSGSGLAGLSALLITAAVGVIGWGLGAGGFDARLAAGFRRVSTGARWTSTNTPMGGRS